MHSRPGSRLPSPALVIAVIALFAGLGGAAYAVKLGKNDVKTRHIAPKAVKGSKIAKNAVKTAKIRDGAVLGGKIAANGVSEAAIAEHAVSRRKIKAQAVTTPKVADTAVETRKLADAAVTAAKLAPGSVTGAAALASITVTVDPPASGCARATAAVAGAAGDDHVVVTAPAGLPASVVATGDVAPGQVGVRVCNGGTDDPGPTDFNVLVIG